MMKKLFVAPRILAGMVIAVASFHGIAALGASGADDWHSHGPEKMSSVAARVVGSGWKGWTINWQAGDDPVVDPDALWKAGVLMDGTKDLDGPYDAVNLFFGDVSHLNPAWAFAACWNQHHVLTVVPMDKALDEACRTTGNGETHASR